MANRLLRRWERNKDGGGRNHRMHVYENAFYLTSVPELSEDEAYILRRAERDPDFEPDAATVIEKYKTLIRHAREQHLRMLEN